jgi:hypothetical protein
MRPAATICVAILLALGAAGASAQLMIETTVVEVQRDWCNKDRKQLSVTTMQASGGSGNYQWLIVDGRKPRGLKRRSNGKWKGTVDWDWFESDEDRSAVIQVTDRETGDTQVATVAFVRTPLGVAGSCCSASPRSPRWPAIIACAFTLGLWRLKRVDEQAAS